VTTTSVRRTYSQTVKCPGCGRFRELTDRHVRRGGTSTTLCNLCRFPPRQIPVSNTDRRFWLRRYSDEDIALMAEAICANAERIADRGAIYAWRVRLNIPEPS